METSTTRRAILRAAAATALGAWRHASWAALTGEERLSDKASDEQRVDDCKVPPARRGRSHRPTACTHDVTS